MSTETIEAAALVIPDTVEALAHMPRCQRLSVPCDRPAVAGLLWDATRCCPPRTVLYCGACMSSFAANQVIAKADRLCAGHVHGGRAFEVRHWWLS